MRAFWEALKSLAVLIRASIIRLKSAASTSQSAKTAFFASDANDPTIEVFPVPPFPLIIVSVFTSPLIFFTYLLAS
jgi:hypothetical protein